MAWSQRLPNLNEQAWGDEILGALAEIRTHIEALEAVGTPVAGVSQITAGGVTAAGSWNLDLIFSPLGHAHAGSAITSGTIDRQWLHTGVPVVVVKALGGYGASAGSWPANRAAIVGTNNTTRSVFFVGDVSPVSIMDAERDLFFQV
jgi:hypothetical protein